MRSIANLLHVDVVCQYLLQPGRGLTGAEVNQIHIHGGSALLEVGLKL